MHGMRAVGVDRTELRYFNLPPIGMHARSVKKKVHVYGHVKIQVLVLVYVKV